MFEIKQCRFKDKNPYTILNQFLIKHTYVIKPKRYLKAEDKNKSKINICAF